MVWKESHKNKIVKSEIASKFHCSNNIFLSYFFQVVNFQCRKWSLILWKHYLLHSLGCLLCNHDKLVHTEFSFFYMKMLVQWVSITPLSHYGKMRFWHQSHKQEYVVMPCFTQHSNLILKSLHLSWCRIWDIEFFHCYWSMPVCFEHSSKWTRANPLIIANFFIWYFPVLIWVTPCPLEIKE